MGSCWSCTPRNGGEEKSELISPIKCLNDDLLIEIFVRLPIHSVFICKAVCEHWLLLITDPSLPSLHRLRARSSWKKNIFVRPLQSSHTYVNVMDNTRKFSLDYIHYNSHLGPLKVISNDNGLNLCSPHKEFQRLYYVGNPLTKQWVALPRPQPRPCDRTMFISYDGSCKTCQFKVVRIFSESDSTYVKLEIFDSETGEWEECRIKIDSTYCYFPPVHSLHGISAASPYDGVLYWIENKRGRIVMCDLAAKVCWPISLPTASIQALGDCEGQLRCGVVSEHGNLKIWSLKTNNGDKAGEWSLEHKILRNEMVFEDPQLASCFSTSYRIGAFLSLDRDIVFLSTVETGTSIICNLQSKRIHRFFHDSNTDIMALPFWPASQMAPIRDQHDQFNP